MWFPSFRFSLRALLVGVTLIVLLLGYVANQAWKQKQIVETLQNEGATVRYKYQYAPFDPPEKASSDPHAEPPWLARFIGIDFCSSVVRVNAKGSRNPDKVARLSAQLHELRWLFIQDCSLRDEHLPPLKQLKNLRGLYLRGTEITDNSVRILSTFKGLHKLSVTNTSLTAEEAVVLESNLPSCDVNFGEHAGGFF